MKNIRLELESFKILKNRGRWDIYFIVYTKHPEDPDKTIIKFIPGSNHIRLKPGADNYFSFKPEGEGTDGLKILNATLPPNKAIDVRMIMMHSRKKIQSVGEKISKIRQELNVADLTPLKWGRLQWYGIGKGFDAVASYLQNIGDRNLGFLCMDEEFENEFLNNPNQKRSQKTSTGEAEVIWIWKLKD